MVSQIEGKGTITSDQEFMDLFDELVGVKNDLDTLGRLKEMANAFFISKLESILPPMVKYEWSGVVIEEKLDTSKEKFERLLIFLARIKACIKYMNADIRRSEYEYVTGIAAPSSVIKKEDMEKAA